MSVAREPSGKVRSIRPRVPLPRSSGNTALIVTGLESPTLTRGVGRPVRVGSLCAEGSAAGAGAGSPRPDSRTQADEREQAGPGHDAQQAPPPPRAVLNDVEAGHELLPSLRDRCRLQFTPTGGGGKPS